MQRRLMPSMSAYVHSMLRKARLVGDGGLCNPDLRTGLHVPYLGTVNPMFEQGYLAVMLIVKTKQAFSSYCQSLYCRVRHHNYLYNIVLKFILFQNFVNCIFKF